MTTTPVGLFRTSTSTIAVGGEAVTLIYGPVQGALIVNPFDPADQDLSVSEPLYVSLIGAATLGETATTTRLAPGQTYAVPATTGNVSVNAATSGHRFSAIVTQPQGSATPGELLGTVNPWLQAVIPSYLYQQYADDQDLQAFVAAYNEIAQRYVTWFNDTPLAIYTDPAISGALLDWIALGLYGVRRPALSVGNVQILGPFDTYRLDGMTFNGRRTVGPAVFTPVSDDIFKRVLTWKLYKGDGKQINVRWLKRRVLRFLLGADGADVDTADTGKVSVTFGGNIITITVLDTTYVTDSVGPLLNSQPFNEMGFNLVGAVVIEKQTIETFQRDNQVNINFLSHVVTGLSGAEFNAFCGNEVPFNDFVVTSTETFSPLPNIATFKEAVDQGVLDMPFQFRVVVNIR